MLHTDVEEVLRQWADRAYLFPPPAIIVRVLEPTRTMLLALESCVVCHLTSVKSSGEMKNDPSMLLLAESRVRNMKN